MRHKIRRKNEKKFNFAEDFVDCFRAVLFAMVWISMEYMAAVKESDISLGWNLILVTENT